MSILHEAFFPLPLRQKRLLFSLLTTPLASLAESFPPPVLEGYFPEKLESFSGLKKDTCNFSNNPEIVNQKNIHQSKARTFQPKSVYISSMGVKS